MDEFFEGEVMVVQCLWLWQGLETQFPLEQGMDLTGKAPNAHKNFGASHQSPQHLALFQRSAAIGLQN